ncbi:gas vesicle protein GvpC, partial [Limnospira fusiformis NRMCF6962]
QGDLQEFNIIRTIMAEKLLQQTQEAKAERLAGIQSMFEDMGKFRMQLQEYRREREKSVWGGERVKSTPATPQKAKASQTLVPQTKPKAVKSAPSTTTAAQSTTPTAVVVAEPTKPAVPPNQPKPTTVVPHPPNPG